MADRVGRAARSKKILVVDDDILIRNLLKEILSGSRYEVLEAQDGREALALIHKISIDLLITDRVMPNMDGLELLKTLRAEGNPVPTLMISAFGEESMWAEAIALGAEDYIVKPFTNESVLKVVKKKIA